MSTDRPNTQGPVDWSIEDLPQLFMPPVDLAHDIYALSSQFEGFDHAVYQDIQQDQAVYDSFQRWPYLFSHALAGGE
jgi:hypothetical protein